MRTTSQRRIARTKGGLIAIIVIGLCLSAFGPAPAATIEYSYDGTYAPDSLTPPAGQSTWTVVTTGGLAIQPNTPNPGEASFPDDSTGGRIQMSNLLDYSGLDFTPDPATITWEYTLRASATAPGYPRTFFGVRDEGIPGKFVMFSHSSAGDNLFYCVSASGSVFGPDIYTGTEDGGSLGDGQMHDYRMVKYDDGGTLMVDFYVDNSLMDTRPYADFAGATDTNNGVGVFTATPGQSNYVIDEMTFTATIPEPVLPTTERATTDVFRYDGTYAPDSATPPAGQSTWDVVATGSFTPGSIQPDTPAPGVATLADDDAGGRLAMTNAVTDAALIAAPQETEWEYRFDMAFTAMDATPPIAFGLRDEGGEGRSVMFAHNLDGDLFWTDSEGLMTDVVYEAGTDGPSLIDGLAHSYRVVKDVKPGEGVDVDFYLDGVLLDTRNYYVFDPDNTDKFPAASHGFGIYGSTPGKASFEIDEVYFGAVVPEPSSLAMLFGGLLLAGLFRRRA